MKQVAILYPVIVQALLTMAVLIMMGPARSRSLRESGKTLDDADVRTGRLAWSEEATKVARNYENQFELPVLFYAVVAFTMITSGVDLLMVSLAWVFAISRLVHAAIHIGPNVVAWRGAAFLVGFAALVIMWVKLALHVL